MSMAENGEDIVSNKRMADGEEALVIGRRDLIRIRDISHLGAVDVSTLMWQD